MAFRGLAFRGLALLAGRVHQEAADGPLASLIQQEIKDDPGPGTVSTRSSFAVEIADAARQVLGP